MLETDTGTRADSEDSIQERTGSDSYKIQIEENATHMMSELDNLNLSFLLVKGHQWKVIYWFCSLMHQCIISNHEYFINVFKLIHYGALCEESQIHQIFVITKVYLHRREFGEKIRAWEWREHCEISFWVRYECCTQTNRHIRI